MAVETPVCVEEFHLIYNSSRAEAKVLMDFKASLASLASDKPEWMETWVGGTEHCLWERVTCQGGLVSGVDLHDANVHGVLPDAFAELRNLTSLDFGNNFFSGM